MGLYLATRLTPTERRRYNAASLQRGVATTRRRYNASHRKRLQGGRFGKRPSLVNPSGRTDISIRCRVPAGTLRSRPGRTESRAEGSDSTSPDSQETES